MTETYSCGDLFASADFPLTVRAHKAHSRSARPHYHACDEIAVIRSGTAVHMAGDEELNVSTGDVLVIPSPLVHGFKHHDRLRLTSVMYDPKQLLTPRPEILKLPGYHALFSVDAHSPRARQVSGHVRLEAAQLRGLVELVERMAHEEDSRVPGYESMMRACFMQTVVYLARHFTRRQAPTPGTMNRLAHVIGHMESNYEQVIQLDDLAAMAHMSKNNLLRVFKRIYTVTPIEYLIRLRMARACDLMQDASHSISDIAYAVGFSDSNYFSRRFRSFYGMSPSQYRQRVVESAAVPAGQ